MRDNGRVPTTRFPGKPDSMPGSISAPSSRWLALSAAAMFVCLLLAGCSMSESAGGAYDFIEASRPEASTLLQLSGSRGSCDVALEFPKGYTKAKSYPVMVVIQDRWQQPLPDLSRAASSSGFILATPALPSMGAQEKAGESRRDALLDCLELLEARLVAEYAANPRRIMLMGRGEDAAIVQKMACARSHAVGGLVLVDPPAAPEGCRPVHPIPAAVLTSSAGSSASAEFWARNNGCEGEPQELRKGNMVRERYECPLPASSVQRYALLEATDEGDSFASFPSAWAALEFLARESGR